MARPHSLHKQSPQVLVLAAEEFVVAEGARGMGLELLVAFGLRVSTVGERRYGLVQWAAGRLVVANPEVAADLDDASVDAAHCHRKSLGVHPVGSEDLDQVTLSVDLELRHH
jgi:hypothetical protein